MRAPLLVCLWLAPATLWAQAEPAPPEYVPPQQLAPPPSSEVGPPRYTPRAPELPKWRLSFAPRLSFLLGAGPAALPTLGYGGGFDLTRALASSRQHIRVGIGLGFAYDRFHTDLVDGSRTLSHATFAASLVLDALLVKALLRPWASIGAGFSVGQYLAPPDPGSATDISIVEVLPLLRAALGLSVKVYENVELGLRGQFEIGFSSTAVGEPARTVFSPGLAALALDVGFRF